MAHTIVVKIGGSTFNSGDTTLADLITLQKAGQSLVVVHGGGDMISDWLGRMDIKSTFIGGFRVTDETTLSVVVAVLAGLVNKELVAAANGLGGKAFGMSGVDGSLIEARIKDERLGLVGEVTKVNTALIDAMLKAGFMPLIAPIGWKLPSARTKAVLLNLNGDTLAGALAAALEADRLIFLTDVDGVMGKDGSLIEELVPDKARGLISSGAVSKGMIPKVEACLAAVKKTRLVRIINGTMPNALLNEMQGKLRGTTVVKA